MHATCRLQDTVLDVDNNAVPRRCAEYHRFQRNILAHLRRALQAGLGKFVITLFADAYAGRVHRPPVVRRQVMILGVCAGFHPPGFVDSDGFLLPFPALTHSNRLGPYVNIVSVRIDGAEVIRVHVDDRGRIMKRSLTATVAGVVARHGTRARIEYQCAAVRVR